jgi:hypothetical protein
MANTITGNLSVTIEGLDNAVSGGQTRTGRDRIASVIALANGTTSGTNKIDRKGAKFSQTLAASESVNFDLAGSTFTDLEGTAMTMAKLKLVAILNWNTVAGDYLLFRMGSSAGLADNTILADETHKITVQPTGGACPFIWPATLFGVTVTATTADIISLENPSANTITYDIIVLGTSA